MSFLNVLLFLKPIEFKYRTEYILIMDVPSGKYKHLITSGIIIFQVFDAEGVQSDIKEIVLEPGARVDLCLTEDEDVESIIGQTALVREKYLQIKVLGNLP